MTAPSPAAAGLPAADVERVARALLRAILGDTDGGLFLDGDLPAAEVARLIREEAAAAALAEMRPTAAEEAVKRVEALIAFYDRHEYSVLNVDDLRAALAPVSHDADGGEER